MSSALNRGFRSIVDPKRTAISQRYWRFKNEKFSIKQKYKEKYGYWNISANREELDIKAKRRVDDINHYIKRTKRRLDLIDSNKRKVEELGKSIEEFTDTKIFRCIRPGKGINKAQRLAIAIFCKYGIEHGINGHYLSLYTGGKYSGAPARARKRFTQSFRNNLENRELYHNFVLFVNG